MGISNYVGNDSAVPPFVQIPDSAEPPSPAVIMAAAEGNRDGVATLDTRSQLSRIRNWQPPIAVTASGVAGPYCAKWDNVRQWWLIATFTTGAAVNVMVYSGQGTDPAVPLTATRPNLPKPATSIATDAAGNVVVCAPAVPTGGAVSFCTLAPGGSAFGPQEPTTADSTTAVDVKMTSWGSTIAWGSIGASSGLWLGNLALSSGVYVPVQRLNNAGSGLGGVGTLILKNNGSSALAIGGTGAPSGCLSFLSPDGITWSTAGANLGGAISGIDTVIDVAWNAAAALWIAAVNLGSSPGHVGWYTSPDGLSWTATGTVFTNAWVVASVESVGSYWVATVYTTATDACRVIYSRDGVSWYGTQSYLTPVFPIANRPRVHVSPTQLLLLQAIAESDTSSQLSFRFSLDIGKTSQVFL